MADQFEKSLKDLEAADKRGETKSKLGKVGTYRSTLNLPINRIIIITLGIVLPIYVFRDHVRPVVLPHIPEKHVQTFDKILPPERSTHSHHHDEEVEMGVHSGVHGHQDSGTTHTADGKPVKNAPQKVLINGQYYDKTPDNVYIINGKRVFYKSNK